LRLPTLALKVPPPAVGLAIAVLMWLVSRTESEFGFVLPAHQFFAILLIAGGFLLGIAGVMTFRRARTTVNPMRPRSSTSLVTWGVYALTRNPMYLGGLIMLTGWAIFLSNALAFLFLPAYIVCINHLQIAPEERALNSLFGEEFVAYQARVRRWL
jgi:protein-S-isoprenylcysteine O-methyltransferase Ste14